MIRTLSAIQPYMVKGTTHATKPLTADTSPSMQQVSTRLVLTTAQACTSFN